MKTKVLLEREGYRFIEAGILEINGKPDYRLQKQNYYTKRWNDIYLFDNVIQCSTAMEDIEYAKWLDPDRVPCYVDDDDILDWDQQSRDDYKRALVGSNLFMKNTDVLRYIGNILLLSGYFVLLWGDPKVGLLVKCVGNAFVIPFAIKYKFWDILILCGFYAAIEVPKLIQLTFPSLSVNQVVEPKDPLL